MIPYFIFILFIIFFYSKKNPKGLLFSLVLFAVLRYNTGWDYANYVEITSNPTALERALNDYSFLWDYFFKFCYNHGVHHLAIIIPNIITYFLIYYSLNIIFKDDVERIAESLTVYALWPFFYLSSFSIIRQCLAVGVVLLVYALIKERKLALSFILVILAYYIHPSSLVCVMLYPLCLLNFKLKFWQLILIGLLLVASIFYMSSIISFLGVEALSNYADIYLGGSDNFGSKLSYLLFLIICYFSYVWMNNYEVEDRKIYIVIIMAFLMEFSMYMIGLNSFVTRIVSYYSIFLIFSFYDSLRYIGNKKQFSGLLTVLLSALFIVYLILMDTPEARSKSSAPYVPYTFILDK